MEQFAKGLNLYLRENNQGSAEYSTEYEPVGESHQHGKTEAMFHLRNGLNEDALYFYLYTDGTVWGENLVDPDNSQIVKGCSAAEAVKEVLQTLPSLRQKW